MSIWRCGSRKGRELAFVLVQDVDGKEIGRKKNTKMLKPYVALVLQFRPSVFVIPC